jgi:hypothetical protein
MKTVKWETMEVQFDDEFEKDRMWNKIIDEGWNCTSKLTNLWFSFKRQK